MVYRGILDMHYTLSQRHFLDEWARVCDEWNEEERLRTFCTYFYVQWIRSRFWKWQMYHSPSGYATTNNPCEVFNASIKRYTQRKSTDTRRLLQKLMIIIEDYGVCVPPTTYMTPSPPPQEAKRLARTLVSTNRVAVYASDEQSVVRVLYLGDRDDDTEMANELSELSELRVPDSSRCRAPISPDSLTDEEKTTAAKFYRSAVKWSVRRAHHIGMPRGGWVVRLATFECSCYFYMKFQSCAHIFCGRAAFGMSVPGVNGYNMKFKDHRVRKTRSHASSVRAPHLGDTQALVARSETFVNRSHQASGFAQRSHQASGLDQAGADMVTRDLRIVRDVAQNLCADPDHGDLRYPGLRDASSASDGNDVRLPVQFSRLAPLGIFSSDQENSELQLPNVPSFPPATLPDYQPPRPPEFPPVTLPNYQLSRPPEFPPATLSEFQLPTPDLLPAAPFGFPLTDMPLPLPPELSPVTPAESPGYFSLLGRDNSSPLASAVQRGSSSREMDSSSGYQQMRSIDHTPHLPPPTEYLPIRRQIGRPPLASKALDIQYQLR